MIMPRSPTLLRFILLLFTADAKTAKLLLEKPMIVAQNIEGVNVDAGKIPLRHARLAVCLTGHDRSMHSPIVVAAFEEAFRQHWEHMQTFAVLGLSSMGSVNVTAYEELHADTLQRYQNLSVHGGTLAIVDRQLNNTFFDAFFRDSCGDPASPCHAVNVTPVHQGHWLSKTKRGPLCDRRSVVVALSQRAETGEQWAEQLWKAHLCGAMVQRFEEEEKKERHFFLRSANAASAIAPPFDFVLKWRPDVMLLSPFPALSAAAPVDFSEEKRARTRARGVAPPSPLPQQPQQQQQQQQQQPGASKVFVDRRTLDHYFLCPRASCSGYFSDAAPRLLACAAGSDFGFSGNRKMAALGYGKDRLSFSLPLRYAAFRASSASYMASSSSSEVTAGAAAAAAVVVEGGGGKGGGGRPYDCVENRMGGNNVRPGGGSEQLFCSSARCAKVVEVISAARSGGVGGIPGEEQLREIRRIVSTPLGNDEDDEDHQCGNRHITENGRAAKKPHRDGKREWKENDRLALS